MCNYISQDSYSCKCQKIKLKLVQPKRKTYLTHASEKFRLGWIQSWMMSLGLSLTLSISCVFVFFFLCWLPCEVSSSFMVMRLLTAPSLHSNLSAILVLGQCFFQDSSNDSRVELHCLIGSYTGMYLHSLWFWGFGIHWLTRTRLCAHTGFQR